jgi:hypothetical protein
MSFDEVVAETRCPFSGLATWRELRPELPQSRAEALAALTEQGRTLRPQIAQLDRAEIDMVAVEVSHPELVADLASFTEAVRHFITGLHGCESYQRGELETTEADWLLIVDGVRLFGLTFAPFYQKNHPRHSPTDSAYIVIQFLFSFRKIRMSGLSRAAKRRLSNRVRATFEAAGVPYFAYITQDLPEIMKMIKPLKMGDPPIRWWQSLLDRSSS